MSEDAGDKQQVAARKSKAKLKQEQEDADLKQVLSQREGRAVLWRVLQECGVYHLSFSPDVAVMAFQEGKRKIGLWLLTVLHETAPNAYARMQSEAQVLDQRYEKD